MRTWPELVVWLACLAGVWDLGWHTIPRWLSLPAGVLGLIHAAVTGRELSSLLAAGVGLVVGAGLWQIKAFGGGDAKWLAAMGALVGVRVWCLSVSLALLVAAGLALVQLARRRRLAGLGARWAAILRGWWGYGLRPHPELNLEAAGAVTAPMAPALAIGLICALWLI